MPMILPSPAKVQFTSGVNVVWDGNSLVAGVGASNAPTNALPALVNALPPIAGGSPLTNLGIGGQTTRQMDGLDGGSASDVDGAFVAGMTNVLVLWEGTNSICNAGQSAAQALSDLATYIADRKAAHPSWIIMGATTLPRAVSPLISTQADITSFNGILAAYNALLVANARAIGLRAIADVRQPGSPYAMADYNQATFNAMGLDGTGLWSSAGGAYTHPTDRGYALLAPYFAASLRRMPTR